MLLQYSCSYQNFLCFYFMFWHYLLGLHYLLISTYLSSLCVVCYSVFASAFQRLVVKFLQFLPRVGQHFTCCELLNYYSEEFYQKPFEPSLVSVRCVALRFCNTKVNRVMLQNRILAFCKRIGSLDTQDIVLVNSKKVVLKQSVANTELFYFLGLSFETPNEQASIDHEQASVDHERVSM